MGSLYLKHTKQHPAPGYRINTSGAMNYVGYGGFSNSSSVSGIFGLDLNFKSENLYISHLDYRAHGFQLRCLSE